MYGSPGTAFLYEPAVMVDVFNNVFLVFNRSSASEFVGLHVTGRLVTEPANTLQASAQLKAGLGPYSFLRWGDYSDISLDPANQVRVWVAGEYADSGDRWATWVGGLQLQTFSDEPPTDYAFARVEEVFRRGITAGCFSNPTTGERRFCPNDSVSRREMAIFIIKAMGQTPCTTCPQDFDDVPPSDFAFGFVERMFQLGITAGCGVRLYCPDNPVLRRQMAIFLMKAKGQTPCTTCPQDFDDVPPTDTPYFGWIERLFQLGITSGCAVRLFCPDNNVLRKDMAIFLVLTFP